MYTLNLHSTDQQHNYHSSEAASFTVYVSCQNNERMTAISPDKIAFPKQYGVNV